MAGIDPGKRAEEEAVLRHRLVDARAGQDVGGEAAEDRDQDRGRGEPCRRGAEKRLRGRFADALRLLAQQIDFVVITHNRATIETADTIYGVTMTDAAVSRLLSLRLADLPAEVAAG